VTGPGSGKLAGSPTAARVRAAFAGVFLFWAGLEGEVLAQQAPAAPPIDAGAVLRAGSVVVGALAVGLFVYLILLKALRRWAARTSADLEKAVQRYSRWPLLILMPLVAVAFSFSFIPFSPELALSVKRIHSILLIATVAWVVTSAIRVAEYVILAHYDIQARDNLKARALQTQINVFRNIATFAIAVLAFALILMSFDQVRQLGVSLLASAGVAGIIIGFAAQRTIATVLAGVQIAITQPIRLDDVVIVENEWGWIEEITLTYVVVRIWDLRRLVVPITHFIEQPFQNWTRTSADILGSVFVYMDYSVPVEEVRTELKRIVARSSYWDGKVCVLHVTNATDRTIELRALMSAADSPAAWELRCEVREKLIAFLREKYPASLPRVRAEVEGASPPPKQSAHELPAADGKC
jgi:small-conductance mechanosensitive channel